MTELIEKQLTIMFYMCVCGLTSGMVLDVFRLFKRRFLNEKKISTIILGIFASISIAYLIEEYSFYCQNGKITFTGGVAFFVGLWLWYKYFCDIISLGEKHEQKGKKTSPIRKE